VEDVAARYQLLGDLNAREASGDAPPDFDVLEELWKQYPPHRFVLEARVTEPRWLEGLPSWFATTAYDVWESDPMVAGGPDLVRSPWTSGTRSGFILSGAALSDLGASSDGRRIFARVRHDHALAGAASHWVAPPGAGAVVAFDADTLAEEARLELGPLLVRYRENPDSVAYTRPSPRGDAVWVVSHRTAGLYRLGPERAGERVDVAECTRAGYFSAIAFDAASGDSVLTSRGGEVETRPAPTAWPGVRATHAVIDAERIAAVGPRDLCVYDRRARAERFRVAVGTSSQVALLPGGRTAVISGPYQTSHLRVFDGDGQLVSAFKMKFATAMKASPSGLLAICVGGILQVVDLTASRAVVVTEELVREVAWLDDARLAVIGGEGRGLAVIDVREALSAGSAVGLEKPAARKPSARKPKEDG
jgi:hypothetical protein